MMLEEEFYKRPTVFFCTKCPACGKRNVCVRASAFHEGVREYPIKLHRRSLTVTEQMLAGKEAHESAESGIPTIQEALDQVIDVVKHGGTIKVKEVPVHSVEYGLRGVCDRVTIEHRDGRYNIVIDELKSSYWNAYWLQLACYGLIFFSPDAEIILKPPIEEKLKNLADEGILIQKGCASLLNRIRSRVDVLKLVDYIVEKEGMLTGRAIKRLYHEGIFACRPPPRISAINLYKKKRVSVSIELKLVILEDGKEYPLDFAVNDMLTPFGFRMKQAIEKRLKSLRRWHRPLSRSLYELETVPYCKECGVDGSRCKFPDICLRRPPMQTWTQLHFSEKTGNVVKTPPVRVL